jgi:hypothetical protein
MSSLKALLATGAFFVLMACQSQMSAPKEVRDINQVLAAHSAELMAMPGVVGVYVGLMPDEKTQCLKVMLKDAKSAAAATLPKRLEGFPVVNEVTGEIRPLK